MSYSFASVILPLLGERNADVSDKVARYVKAVTAFGFPTEIILVHERADDGLVSESFSSAGVSVASVTAPQPGWGSAIREGLARAKGDLLLYTNWLSTNPENVALVFSVARANPDMVVKATRRFEGHWVRRLGGALFTAECRQLFDLPYWDINATPKAFPRRFGKLLELQSTDALIETEFCVTCRREQYPVLEIPVDEKHTGENISVSNWLEDVTLYWRVIQLRRRLGAGT
jgi:hypothetical protein